MSAVHVPGDTGVGRGRLWFGLLGGPVAWVAHLMLSYGIAEFGCLSPAGEQTFLGLTVVTWLLLVVSGGTLVTSAAATLTAHRSGLHLRRAEASNEAAQASVYVADAGVIASAITTLTILVESIPIFYYLRGC